MTIARSNSSIGASALSSTVGNGGRSRPSSQTTPYPSDDARLATSRNNVLFPIPPMPVTYTMRTGSPASRSSRARQFAPTPDEALDDRAVEPVPRASAWGGIVVRPPGLLGGSNRPPEAESSPHTLEAMSSVPPSSSAHPATWKFGYPMYHAESRTQWRAWLEANHDATPGVWLCSWRSVTGRPTCPYPAVVEEAICFGWIDSTASRLDDERGLQLLTPRKAKSTWTRLNRLRVADMEAAGLMTDAGRRTVDVAKRNGWWTILDPVEDLVEPDDLSTALDTNPTARVGMGQVPPERPQGDAVVGDQRSEARHQGAQDRDDRVQSHERRAGPGMK